jgi:hypothetical protein
MCQVCLDPEGYEMWKNHNPEEEYQGWLDKNDEGNPKNEVWQEGKREQEEYGEWERRIEVK